MRSQSFTDSTGLLWAEIQRLVLLTPVKFPQVFLLLLMDHNVDTGDGFGDNTDFAQLRCCAAGHFSHTKAAQFGLKVIELFDQLFLLLGTQLGALDTRL